MRGIGILFINNGGGDMCGGIVAQHKYLIIIYPWEFSLLNVPIQGHTYIFKVVHRSKPQVDS